VENKNLAYVLKQIQDCRVQQIVPGSIGNEDIYDRFQQVVFNHVILDIIILKQKYISAIT